VAFVSYSVVVACGLEIYSWTSAQHPVGIVAYNFHPQSYSHSHTPPPPQFPFKDSPTSHSTGLAVPMRKLMQVYSDNNNKNNFKWLQKNKKKI